MPVPSTDSCSSDTTLRGGGLGREVEGRPRLPLFSSCPEALQLAFRIQVAPYFSHNELLKTPARVSRAEMEQ